MLFDRNDVIIINRNAERFPPDFMFSLTSKEKTRVVTKYDHLVGMK